MLVENHVPKQFYFVRMQEMNHEHTWEYVLKQGRVCLEAGKNRLTKGV